MKQLTVIAGSHLRPMIFCVAVCSISQRVNVSPLVSTIVPIYNGTRWLRATVESLSRQTHSDHEVILVDDGSVDCSAELIDELAARPGIIAIHQKNAGVAAARNTGIEASRGQYIAFCDQDDLWLPTKLEKQLRLFEEGIGLVYSGVEFRYPDRSKNSVPRGPAASFDSTLAENRICSCTVVLRRELVDQVGAFDADRALMGVDDWHLWLKILNLSRASYVPEVLAVHRVHDTNYSSREDAMLAASLACLSSLESDPALQGRRMDLTGARIAVYDHYGRNFLHYGNFDEARACIRQRLMLSPLHLGTLVRYALISAMPDPVLAALQKTKRRHFTSWAL